MLDCILVPVLQDLRERGKMRGTLLCCSALNISKTHFFGETEIFCTLDYSLQLLYAACMSLKVAKSRCVCLCVCGCVILTSTCTCSHFSSYVVPVWWVFNKQRFMGTYLLIDAFSASTRLSPHQHCWREPCNNLPCFHDNHLLLSSPHLSTSRSLPSLPLFLPLSCLPSLCTLLVFQGQTGSQPDSEIETEIGVESG